MPIALNTLPATDLADAPWVDLLPWLDEYVSSRAALLEPLAPSPDWWFSETPVFTAAEADLDGILSELSRVFTAQHPDLEFATALRPLSDSIPVAALGLGTRASATLHRMSGDGSVGDLLGKRAADLFAVRGTGPDTVHEIVGALLTLALVRDPAVLGAPDSEPTEREPVLRQLVEDLAQLAQWRRVRGEADEPLVRLAIEADAPEQVQEIATRIAALTPADLPVTDIVADPVDELEEVFAQLDERERAVLGRRFLAIEPATQSALGAQLGLSAGRVGQIEAALKAKLARAFGFGTAVGNLLASLRVEIQPVAAMTRLLARHPGIERVVPSVGVPLWLVLDRLDDYFEVTDGWAAAPGVREAKARTLSLLEEFESANGVVELAVIADAAGLPYDEVVQWLGWCGVHVLGDRALTRTRNAGDHAAGILEAAGAALTVDEIVDRMDRDRSPRTVSSALAGDDRLVRAEDGGWSLAEWGTEEYATIRRQIARLIDDHGGRVDLAEVVADIVARFPVSTASVQTYAASGDFEVSGGQVRRRRRRSVESRPPEQTRRCYRGDGVWRYRLGVTRDHLRGSGFPVPAGVAALAGCEHGQSVELVSRLGTQTIRWTGLQPTSGTIRRFLEDGSVGEGAEIFLEFRTGNGFDVALVRRVDAAAPPLARALALIGHDDPESLSDNESAAVLAEGIGLADETRPRRILSAYRARGEDEVSDLLEQAWVRQAPADA